MKKPTPDFNRLLSTLKRQKTDRPVLFEFIINDTILAHFAGNDDRPLQGVAPELVNQVIGFRNLGYDYSIVSAWHSRTLVFPKPEKHKGHTISQNEGAVITDWQSLESYPWPNIEDVDYSVYEKLATILPEGMKLIPCTSGGVLENAVELMGYESLCVNSLMDPDLVTSLFDNIGRRLADHYANLVQFDCVGALMVNDDWGFKTQTMLDTDSMETYVIKWHKEIADIIHYSGKPAIMHSCGNLDTVMDRIIDHIKFDGKHSYEDGILPVEDAYRKWGDRIAILGGLDVDFLCRSNPEDIYKRARKIIEQTFDTGGYALGSGNSIPDYVPREKYMAMLKAAYDLW
jgi:uroporphyrinogen decarboxylase